MGCQLQQGDDHTPIEPEEKSVWQELHNAKRFPIAASEIEGGSFARAEGIVNYGSEATQHMDVNLTILGGQVTFWSTPEGYLVLQGLEVDFDEVSLGPDVVPPNGIDLTGLQARVEFPAVALPASKGDRVSAVIEIDLFTEWALKRDGEVFPMTPVRLDDVPISIEVYRAQNGLLAARLVALREGVFWNWANTFELAELMVDLVSPGAVIE